MNKGKVYNILAVVFGVYLMITNLYVLLMLLTNFSTIFGAFFIILSPLASLLNIWLYFNVIFFVYLIIKKKHSESLLPLFFTLYLLLPYVSSGINYIVLDPLNPSTKSLLYSSVISMILLLIISILITYKAIRNLLKIKIKPINRK